MFTLLPTTDMTIRSKRMGDVFAAFAAPRITKP